jgi:hypothetical protein
MHREVALRILSRCCRVTVTTTTRLERRITVYLLRQPASFGDNEEDTAWVLHGLARYGNAGQLMVAWVRCDKLSSDRPCPDREHLGSVPATEIAPVPGGLGIGVICCSWKSCSSVSWCHSFSYSLPSPREACTPATAGPCRAGAQGKLRELLLLQLSISDC